MDIINASTYVSARDLKRKLINRLLVIVFIISLVYCVIYLFFDSKSISVPLLAPFFVLPILLYILNYFIKSDLYSSLGLLGFNVSLFMVASSESPATGVYLHFISACSASIALFGYQHRLKSFAFIGLSVTLFILVNLVPMDFIPYREYSHQNQRIFFTMHTLGTTIISCYCLFMLLGQNHDLHRYFRENQRVIEDQNKELRKTNEELDRFVYSTSHDLRAPLSSMKGLVALMELDKKTPPAEYIPKILNRITVMESFINDIVDYSRNARTEVEQQSILLHEMVNEILKSLSHFDNAQKIVFENKVDVSERVISDPYRLKVILSNLIANSIKYADLLKKKPMVNILASHQNGHKEIRIEDNGIGIGPEHLSKIFDMFYRGSSRSKGSGLGLYIAKESAEKMKCKIDVNSEVGVGTIFTIKLPSLIDEGSKQNN